MPRTALAALVFALLVVVPAPAAAEPPPGWAPPGGWAASGASVEVLAPALAAGEAPRRPVGCKRGGNPYRTNGPRNRRQVALTFDDGPSPYTADVIRTLLRFDATATFFVVGNQIPGRERLVRRMVLNGMEPANHSFDHANLAGGGARATSQLVRTSRRLRAAGGFEPCLFRPPYGALSRNLIGRARAAGMMTITWDVDPRDWSTPGAGAIASRVLGAIRPGSIVVLHDGGGPRGQTVAALPTILRGLRRRNLRAVTVTQLLRHEFVYER